MSFLIAGIVGGWEIILILAIVMLLFGGRKLPEFARGFAQSIKEFKKGVHDDPRDSSKSLGKGGHKEV
jgi:sec-independent protein translocase protein TatA